MRIQKLQTFLANSGLRNYLFVKLTTDDGLTGLGEASLEWQEKTVQTLIHEWVEDRIVGTDPFDIESVIGGMIRDQYQGGATIMTAISGVEVAMWDLIGKACGQPVYKLLGGRAHERLPAYANGWYGGASTPEEYANKARAVVSRGYGAMKFDPFDVAWKTISFDEMNRVEAIVSAVRQAVGDKVELLIEVHGRLNDHTAVTMGERLAKYGIGWYEEPVAPSDLEGTKRVKESLSIPVAAGERLCTLGDYGRLTHMRACDVVQPDPAHCGGLAMTKKIAALAQAADMTVSPHVSIGPVALCAALHFDWATPNVCIQENFAEYDVPWRDDLVCGWNPIDHGYFNLPKDVPGLGIELDEGICAKHPYKKNSFPSLWDRKWLDEFTKLSETSD